MVGVQRSAQTARPRVVPVGFRLDADEAIEIGGGALCSTNKWLDLHANPRVAFVVDDLERVNPGRTAVLSLHVLGRKDIGEGREATTKENRAVEASISP